MSFQRVVVFRPTGAGDPMRRFANFAALASLLIMEAAAAAQTARLYVETDPPDALITIDGTACGRSPKLIHDLAPGRHEIRIERTGYVGISKTVDFAPGAQEIIDVRLEVNARAASPARRTEAPPPTRPARAGSPR
jgi:hypothetical protein